MQTSQLKSDLSSLKSRVFSLRSENHVKAPELEELEWMDDYLASQHSKKEALGSLNKNYKGKFKKFTSYFIFNKILLFLNFIRRHNRTNW